MALLRNVISTLAVVALGCTAQAQPNRGACNNRSYATGGAHTVVCPGASTCSCAAPDACCMAGADSNSAACVDPRTCGGFMLTCDGPEDCGGGVCCLTSTGSSCSDASACTGSWICREDSQCGVSPNGTSCNPADYGVQGVNDRGLDGLIGICGS
jgi:hypothetical protein